MIKLFKPMKYPNTEIYEIDLEGNFIEKIKLNFEPYFLASFKKDGYFSCFDKGELKTSKLKPFANKQLNEKFKALKDYTAQMDLIITGEMYSHDLTFNEIGSRCRTQDFESKKSIKTHGKVLTLPETFKFNIFDVDLKQPFEKRYEFYKGIAEIYPDLIDYCEQYKVYSMDEVKELYLKALDAGYEGLVLHHPDGEYKYGRTTVKENNVFKIKPFRTYDDIIIGYDQSEEVNKDAEKKVNELGRSVTSKRKGDRHLIDRIANFIVIHDGYTQRVCCSSMTHEYAEEIWKNRVDYIGKWVEYKGLDVGKKEKLRHVNWLRFREDLD